MPAIANVVINDGAATPVAHTLSPSTKDDKGVVLFEQILPVPVNSLGAKRLTYSQRKIRDNRQQLTGQTRVIFTLDNPTLETLGTNAAGLPPPPTRAYVEDVRIEFTLADRSTKQERKDIRVLTANLLAHAMAVAAIDDLQPSY